MLTNEKTLAQISKNFPDVKLKIVSNVDKGIGNPKKVADMKKLLEKINISLPEK